LRTPSRGYNFEVARVKTVSTRRLRSRRRASSRRDTNAGTFRHESTKSGGGLAGYSYQFTNWAGIEGNYGFTQNSQNYFGSSGTEGVRSDLHQVTGAFVFHFPLPVRHARPYALAGGGAFVFNPTDESRINGINRQTRGTFLYGGGVNWDLTKHVGIRTEYRGYIYKTPDFDTSRLDIDKVTHLAQPSVGLYFKF
jgi:opacity protein-like surface antigen